MDSNSNNIQELTSISQGVEEKINLTVDVMQIATDMSDKTD